MAIKYIQDLAPEDLAGRKVLLRVDFNVPLKKGQITDSSRIDMALPTIELLLQAKISKLILISHLGRPKGEKKTSLSLEPVASYLAEKLDQDVLLTESPQQSGTKQILTLPETKIVMLENIRFDPGEEKNDFNLARSLAEYADLYVNDAFSACHRKHASVHAIVHYFPKKSYAGLLMHKELTAFQKILEHPDRPFMVLLGGAKVSDKIHTIERLLPIVDKICIGGAMAYPFLDIQGASIGKSLCSDEDKKLAKQILAQKSARSKIILPKDHVAAKSPQSPPVQIKETNIPDHLMGLDIGPQTVKLFSDILTQGRLIFWNGPMGLFERDAYATGSIDLAKTLAKIQGYTLVGGGDSVAAVKKAGQEQDFSHVSSGGGAGLEYIENGTLPAIEALKYGVEA